MEDVRLLLRVCVMLLPLPIFWALYDQQVYMLSAEKLHTGTHTHTLTYTLMEGSRWTLQAARMNGRLGSYTLPPDQMQAINAVLILLFIPLFETIIYPLFGICGLLKK